MEKKGITKTLTIDATPRYEIRFAFDVSSFEEVSFLPIAVVFVSLEDPSSNKSLVPFKLQVASSISERERDGGT
jgi:hypothetical protein